MVWEAEREMESGASGEAECGTALETLTEMTSEVASEVTSDVTSEVAGETAFRAAPRWGNP